MKLGCSSWSYHAALRDGRIDQMNWLRICADEMELDGVELLDLHFPTTDPTYLRELKRRCTDLQLTIAGVGVSNDFCPEDRRELEIAKVKRWCDVAAYLGAPVVRVYGGWLPHRVANGDPSRIVGAFRKLFRERLPDRRRTWSDVMWALRQCADYASERGVVLAVQNSYADGIIASPASMLQCLHDAGTPWLRACVDPADMPDRIGIDQVLDQTVIARAKVRHVRDDGSDGAEHWPGMLRVLKASRYRGFLLIDYEGGEDPMTAVPRAAGYIRGILQLLARRELLPAAEQRTGDEIPPEFAIVRSAERTGAEAVGAR